MKILFLLPTLGGGGTERFFSTLLRHLDRATFEPHLGVLQAQGEYLAELPADVVLHNLDRSRARYAPPAILRLAKRLRPHAIFSALPQTNMALAVCRPFLPRGTRVFLSESSIASAALRGEVASPRLWKWMYRRFYPKVDKIVCSSESMMEDLATEFRVPRQKLVCIPRPVDLPRMQELAEAGEDPFSGPGPHLVAAGRLCHAKGFDILIAAMPAVLKRLPQAQLAILGDGPLRGELAKQVEGLGLGAQVTLRGFQPKPWRFFRHADLFVLSSRYEGLPNVVLEALALGVPVIASDCPSGIREIAQSDPRITLVRSEDPTALADAIVRGWEKAKEIPVEARPRLELPPRFELENVMREYTSLFAG